MPFILNQRTMFVLRSTRFLFLMLLFNSLKEPLVHGWLSSSSGRLTRHLTQSALRFSSASAPPSRLFREELNIIYDSKCNVCKLEIDFLRNRDLQMHGPDATKLKFTDLEGETGEYDAADPANGGVEYAAGMASMHGIWGENGQVRTGVPVFRKAYELVGLGWLFSITRVKGISWLADRGYDLFAKYRTNITRGASVDDLVKVYREQQELRQAKALSSEQCTDGSCDTVSIRSESKR